MKVTDIKNTTDLKTYAQQYALGRNRKGMAQFIDYAVGFGVAIVGFVIVVILLQSLQTSSGVTTNSYAYNVTGQGLVFANNFSTQWGLAGTILGYTLVLAILALIGVGGFAAYQKYRGGR